MPSKIILIRHGQTDYNRDRRIQGQLDIPLNQTGLKQAQSMAMALRDEPINAIYSSDLVRAAQTAQPLAELKNIKIKLSSQLREHQLGVFEGWSWEQEQDYRQDLWDKLMDSFHDPTNPDWKEHQGESIREHRARIHSFMSHLHTHHQDKNIVVVTHGGTIRRFLEVTSIQEYGGDEITKNTEIITLLKNGSGYTKL